MDLESVVDAIHGFSERRGFESKPSIGLLSPAFPTEFNVSAGHDYSLEIFDAEKPLGEPVTFALIDSCFRRIDLDLIGHSDFHLSLFHVGLLGFGFSSDRLKQVAQRAISGYLELLTSVVGLPRERLMITVCDGWKEKKITPDDGRLFADTFTANGISKKQILPVKGRRSFFLSQNSECAGPTCEIFFRVDGGFGKRWLEFGSVNLYRYRNDADVLHHTNNCVLVTAIGIERMLAALQSAPSIFRIDCVEPLVRLVTKQLSQPSEGEIYFASVRRIVDAFRSTAFLLSEGIDLDQSSRGRILRRLLKRARSQVRYLDISTSFIGPFVDLVVEIYGGLCPNLVNRKSTILRRTLDFVEGVIK